MLTIRDLLEDPVYREYHCRVPKTPAAARDPRISPQWRVFLQRSSDRRWLRKNFRSYAEAFRFLKTMLKEVYPEGHPHAGQFVYHDGAINNRRIQFEPPTRFVRIKGKFIKGSDGVKRQATKVVPWNPDKLTAQAEEHYHPWCPYCRRPSVFRWFFKHHSITVLDPTQLRCTICGASDRLTQNRNWYR